MIISPSTEMDIQESSRALITTRKLPLAGTAGLGGLAVEAGGRTAGDGVDTPAVVVAGSAGLGVVAEESTDSIGFC